MPGRPILIKELSSFISILHARQYIISKISKKIFYIIKLKKNCVYGTEFGNPLQKVIHKVWGKKGENHKQKQIHFKC